MAIPPKRSRAFISFDYDHDDDLRKALLAQAKMENTPFAFEDWSIKRESKDWKEDARKRIKRCDLVIVICGHDTNRARGVSEELGIAREEDVPYHLLRGRTSGTCRRPAGTSWMRDPIIKWTWPNIAVMCSGTRRPLWKILW